MVVVLLLLMSLLLRLMHLLSSSSYVLFGNGCSEAAMVVVTIDVAKRCAQATTIALLLLSAVGGFHMCVPVSLPDVSRAWDIHDPLSHVSSNVQEHLRMYSSSIMDLSHHRLHSHR